MCEDVRGSEMVRRAQQENNDRRLPEVRGGLLWTIE
jgi:hypothetical protein